MGRPGAGLITVIHDPVDDPEITHTALAAHDVRRGQIVVHPTVGARTPSFLAADILTALGARIGQDTAGAQHLGTPDAIFAAAAAWLLADGVDLVIVLRAHRLTEHSRHWLEKLAVAAQLRVIAVWHDRRPLSWAEAFGAAPYMIHETDDLNAAFIGAHLRPVPGPELPAEHLPNLAAMPRTGLACFRAQARRELTSAQFAAVDAHYRHGLEHACAWLGAAHHHQYHGPPGAAASAHPDRGSAGDRVRHPIPWPDPIGLQGFLTRLSGTALTPSATIARVRGAQAGMLLHGVALQVPAALADETGPGLTGTCVTTQVAATIRRRLAHPRLAAAVTLTAVTGRSAQDLTGHEIPLPSAYLSDLINAGTGYRGRAYYAIPPPARPMIDAAVHFSELRHNDEGHLLAGLDAEQVRRAARSVGIVAALDESAGMQPQPRRLPWHTLAAAWIVGGALDHRCRAEAALPTNGSAP